MKRLLFISTLVLMVSAAVAQPPQRRAEQQAQQQTKQNAASSAMSMRAQISFPTAVEMPEEVVWRRDIYREISLEDDANGGLYYPVEPQGKQLNLFTYIFKLALNGYIPVYEYPTDGSDVFTDATKADMKALLDNYHIYYEEKDGKIRVDNSDIPSAMVKKYYLKESAYYDQANSSFHIKVQAFCPVMLREDDFGGEAAKYPLFWVKYSDVEPYLSRQSVRMSERNDASMINLDDYFTRNRYKGKIYKTNNSQGKTLAQIVGGDSIKLSAEQKRIEAELDAFRNNIFGSNKEKQDSIDSTSANQKQKTEKKARQTRTKTAKTKTTTSSSGSSPARVSVRRERH